MAVGAEDLDMLEAMVKGPEAEEPVYSVPDGGGVSIFHDAEGHEINVGDKVAHEASPAVKLIVVGFLSLANPLESVRKVVVVEYSDDLLTDMQGKLYVVAVDAWRLRIARKARYEDPPA